MSIFKSLFKFFIYILSLLVLSMLIFEIVLRNSTNWLPLHSINYLSPTVVSEIAKKRAQINEEYTFDLNGERVSTSIYHYQPFQKRNLYPHFIVDENGFRNSIYYQEDVDTILLGSSIVLSQEAKKDLGDLYRQDGISALNLAMGGYTLQNSRDAYRKYVIDKNIDHKNVIINLFVGADIASTQSYPKEISVPTGVGKENLPWVINLLNGSIKSYKEQILENIRNIKNQHKISLPYSNIRINYLWWPPEPRDVDPDSVIQWGLLESTINQIINLANSANATVTLVVVPSPASVYAVKFYPEFTIWLDNHNMILDKLRKIFVNINIIDPNNEFAKAIEDEFLYVAESEAHLNTYGVKVLYDAIKSNIEILP